MNNNLEVIMESYGISNYRIIVRKQENIYVLLVPEISIIGRGNTLKDAYIDLTSKLEAFLSDANNIGILETVQREIFSSHYNSKDSTTSSGSKKYLYLILSIIILIILGYLGNFYIKKSFNDLSNKIENKLHNIITIESLGEPIIALTKRIEKIPEKRREEIKNSLQKLVIETKPYLIILKPLLNLNDESDN